MNSKRNDELSFVPPPSASVSMQEELGPNNAAANKTDALSGVQTQSTGPTGLQLQKDEVSAQDFNQTNPPAEAVESINSKPQQLTTMPNKAEECSPEAAAFLNETTPPYCKADFDADRQPELANLRELLFAKELEELEDLSKRVKNPAEHAKEISKVVTEALLLRTAKDDKLNSVLAPTVDYIFKESLRQNPEDVADQIFPVIGPAIRRSIAESLRTMLQSLNKTLEMSLSWKGLRWRFEAWRTGKSFSEIVLLNTLIYRVEQVFLIHTETGLVLEHMVNEGVQSEDADLVSGMLTAMQDFVADCFARGSRNDGAQLESLQMADRKIFLVRSPKVYLACVVQGEPPMQLLSKMRSTLELILVEFNQELSQFKGDTAPFKKCRRYFEPFMVSRFVDMGKKASFFIRALPFAVVAILFAGFVFLKIQQFSWEKTFEKLSQEPGIVVTRVEPSLFGTWQIYCMQDTMANDPVNFLTENGIPPNRYTLHVHPFLSLDGHLVRERVLRAISPPAGVNMTFDDNQVLHFSGKANMGWILATREKALSIPGVKDVDTENLRDPRTGQLKALVEKVEKQAIYFPVDKPQPLPEDRAKLEQSVETLVEIEHLAQEMGVSISLIIYGHADATGSAKYNYDLSQERAKALAAMLYARGSSIPISAYGMGYDYASRAEGRPTADPKSRKIELKVILTKSGTALPDFIAN